MTAKPENTPSQNPSGVQPNAGQDLDPSRPVTKEELAAAIPLLLSVTARGSDDSLNVLKDAEADGAHIVHRQLSSFGARHYYKVVCDQPGDRVFKTYLVQPSTNPDEFVRLLKAFIKVDDTVETSPNTGFTVADGYGPTAFHLSADGPTYYFVVGFPDDNQFVNAPYTLVVLEVKA